MDPTAPVQTKLSSGDVYPSEEMAPYMETVVSDSQHQVLPNPGSLVDQKEAPLQQSPVIVVQTDSVPPVGADSVQLKCPVCKSNVFTSVTNDSSPLTYICCMLMCMVGCCLCSCIPFCMDNFKVYKHSCPNCGAFIGSYRS